MFKVGDKVKVIKDTCGHARPMGTILTLKEKGNCFGPMWLVEGGGTFVRDADIVSISEKIVITTDGTTTIARLYDGGKVVKTAEAKCAPGDTYSFELGACIAVGRLYDREVSIDGVPVIVKTNTSPQYKPGDKVKVIANTCHHYAGIGEVITLKDLEAEDKWHYQENHGYIREKDIEPYTEPKPEPKHYSGKVICVDNDGDEELTVGMVYVCKDGIMRWDDGNEMQERFKSLSHINAYFSASKVTNAKFIEYKGEAEWAI